MSLINNDVMELNLFQVTETNSYSFKRSNNDIKLSSWNSFFNDILTLLFGGDQFDNPAAWQPFFELVFPISQSNFWSDDDVWPLDFLKLLDKWNNWNCLDSFS